MSGMADEMARRMREDGSLQQETDQAPGTGGASGRQSPPPAGESNTDTATPPETIPYARFKEVNDRYQSLKDFEQLTEYGYDSDSLGRLAAFEAQYLHDPVGTWAALADNLDLPDDLANAVKAHVAGNPTSASVPAQGEPSGENGSTSDLPEEVKNALEYVGQLRQREESENEDKLLNDTLSYWDKLDEADGLKTSQKMQLAIISAISNSGVVFPTTEKLVEAARDQVLEYRDEVLGSAVRTGRGGSPLSVPGGRPAPAGPVDFGMDIKAATKAAASAIERGELPPIVRD